MYHFKKCYIFQNSGKETPIHALTISKFSWAFFLVPQFEAPCPSWSPRSWMLSWDQLRCQATVTNANSGNPASWAPLLREGSEFDQWHTWETVLLEAGNSCKNMLSPPSPFTGHAFLPLTSRSTPRYLAVLPFNPFLTPFFLLCWATFSVLSKWTAPCWCQSKTWWRVLPKGGWACQAQPIAV